MNCSRFFMAFVCACLAISGICSAHDHDTIQQPMASRLGIQVEKDVELFSSRTNGPGIIQFLDTTSTQQGHNELKELLQNLVADTHELHKRQDLCIFFDNHPEVLVTLKDLLQSIGNAEQPLKRILDTSDAVKQSALGEFYIPGSQNKIWNKSALALDAWQVIHGILLAAPTLEHLALHYFLTEGARKFLGVSCSHDHHHDHHHENDDQCDHHVAWYNSALYYAFHTTHTAIHAVGIASLASQFKAKIATINQLLADLRAIRELIEASQELNALIQNHSVLNEFFNERTTLHNTLNSKTILSAQQALNHFAFTHQASSYQRPGIILSAYAHIQDAKQELHELLNQLGIVDAFVSLGNVYHKSQASEKRFSLATYSDTSSPQCQLEHAWHPMIIANTTTRSVKLGVEPSSPRGMIITGQNMAGKSTTLKMTALCIIMAQTCGFVPARSMSLTPFSHVVTSFSLTDDLRAGLSSFAAELASAESINHIIENASGLVFVAIDELFIGTNAIKGATTLKAFLRQLANNAHICGMVSTHYEDMISLAQELPFFYAHYLATVLTQESGAHEYQCIRT